MRRPCRQFSYRRAAYKAVGDTETSLRCVGGAACDGAGSVRAVFVAKSTSPYVGGAARFVARSIPSVADAEPSVVRGGGAAVVHAEPVRTVLVAEASGFHFCGAFRN